MKRVAGMIPYTNDRLVIRWIDKRTREVLSQGKRVGGNCPLTPDERRVYVSGGMVRTIKYLMDQRRIGLREARDLFDRAVRGRW